MSRETVAVKARRYLSEGRLLVTRVGDETIEARCRGGGALYDLGWNPADRWWCSCPARSRCSHLEALKLVAVVTDLEDQT